MKISLVAAVARGGVIGREGGLPWRLPEDMAHFRAVTIGHPVVMGRRTWESLPADFRPLPGRRNVVVTRDASWHDPGAERAASVEDALQLLASEEHVSVIGGGEIFAAALPHADELLLTEIDLDVEGDTLFPDWDRASFAEVKRDEHTSDDGTRFAFVTYRRCASGEGLATRQLSALADVDALLEEAGCAYWLFGGWAVDFHVGSVSRPHDDVDIAVWLEDVPRIAALLGEGGWSHSPEPDEDGGTGYERDGVRLELTYLVRRSDGRVVTPLRGGEAPWPEGAFGADVRRLDGVRARLVGREALATGKSSSREGPDHAAKDRTDTDLLSRIERTEGN